MSLPETRMKLSVRISDRAHAHDNAPFEDRLTTFGQAYATIMALESGTPEWTEDSLNAAWSLVEDSFPRGTEADTLLLSMVRAFDAMTESATPPQPRQPSRPRRDA